MKHRAHLAYLCTMAVFLSRAALGKSSEMPPQNPDQIQVNVSNALEVLRDNAKKLPKLHWKNKHLKTLLAHGYAYRILL